MSPWDRAFRTERRLCEFWMIGCWGESAEMKAADASAIRGSKDRSNISEATDVVEQGVDIGSIFLGIATDLVGEIAVVDKLGGLSADWAAFSQWTVFLDRKPKSAARALAFSRMVSHGVSVSGRRCGVTVARSQAGAMHDIS